MKRLFLPVILVAILSVLLSTSVLAQESPPLARPDLLVMTDYPAQTATAGETVALALNLEAGSQAQVVALDVGDLPDGWSAAFRGQNKVVQSVFVEPERAGSVDLRVDIPADAAAGDYTFEVIARGENQTSRLPITLTVTEKGPAQLGLTVDLPTLRGKPDSLFRYNGTLENDGDADLTVDLSADLPAGFTAVFKSSSQEITSLPIAAGASERITIEVDPLYDDLTPAGQYPIMVLASGGALQTQTQLIAEVTGEPRLSLSTPDSRLSGNIDAGVATPLTLVLTNSGSAPAHNVTLTASQPSGWAVAFDPEVVPEVAPGDQTEVTARIQPAEKALAGDYLLTFRAKPDDSVSQSVEYRATVQTSTQWGIIGVGLIAVAVLGLGLAVARFGRR